MISLKAQNNESGFTHHLALIAAVVVIGLASFGTYNLVKSKAAVVSTYIYLAPAGQCNDANTGLSSTAPACSFTRAQGVLQSLQAQGQAQGNIYIKMTPGTYASSASMGTFSVVSKPGYTSYVVPNWYVYGMTKTAAAGKPLPTINCGGTQAYGPGAYGMTVASKLGGNLNMSFLRVTNCSNGIVAGGNYTLSCARPGIDYANGSNGYRPLDSMTLYAISIDHIGSLYHYGTQSFDERGEAGLNINNTSRISIRESLFTRIQNTAATTGYLHALYVKRSSNVTVDHNYFSYVSGDVMRERNQVSNVSVTNNTFAVAGDGGVIADWHIGKAYGATNHICLERVSSQPSMSANTWDHKNYAGNTNISWWRVYYAD